MKSKLQMRHWCEHCKKSGSRAPAILKHERGCTNNWQRTCGMCERAGNVQESSDALWAAFMSGGFPAMRQLCAECPACTLMILRRKAKLREPDDWASGPNPDDGRGAFDFKAECKAFWADINDSGASYY